MIALRYGVARGIFSNESGMGSAAIAAAAAQTTHPVRQGLVSMTQTFIDTIIVVTFTGLVIVTTGAWESGEQGAAMTSAASPTASAGTGVTGSSPSRSSSSPSRRSSAGRTTASGASSVSSVAAAWCPTVRSS